MRHYFLAFVIVCVCGQLSADEDKQLEEDARAKRVPVLAALSKLESLRKDREAKLSSTLNELDQERRRQDGIKKAEDDAVSALIDDSRERAKTDILAIMQEEWNLKQGVSSYTEKERIRTQYAKLRFNRVDERDTELRDLSIKHWKIQDEIAKISKEFRARHWAT